VTDQMIDAVNRLAKKVKPESILVAKTSPPLPAAHQKNPTDLKACNGTGAHIMIALGTNDEAGWASQGWWYLEPGKCTKLIPAESKSSTIYVHAEDTNGNQYFAGSMKFCARDSDFLVKGSDDCASRGYQTRTFHEVDTVNLLGGAIYVLAADVIQ